MKQDSGDKDDHKAGDLVFDVRDKCVGRITSVREGGVYILWPRQSLVGKIRVFHGWDDALWENSYAVEGVI